MTSSTAGRGRGLRPAPCLQLAGEPVHRIRGAHRSDGSSDPGNPGGSSRRVDRGGARLRIGRAPRREIIGVNYENDFRAIAGCGELYRSTHGPGDGGQNSKFILIERDAETRWVGIGDYEKSGDCAAGTAPSSTSRHFGSGSGSKRSGSRVIGGQERQGGGAVLGVREVGHDPRPAEGISTAGDTEGIVRGGCAQLQEQCDKGRRLEKPAAFVGGVAANKRRGWGDA